MVMLTVFERLSLMPLLPHEGNYVTLTLIRNLTQKLGLKDEEFRKYDIKEADGKVSWNASLDTGTEISLGEKETDVINQILTALDKENKLKQEQYSLYEKFVTKR